MQLVLICELLNLTVTKQAKVPFKVFAFFVVNILKTKQK
ncbi:hypothetical protein PALI_a0110 [Pseudoalteromonas aliena SW19]|uniref:Uncharacterized protein n=1 Tax=Pseudoalteromonas aliena SW19 TaxID=1314866 RepID=A0ABR9DX46_9GAMM|nr:hypothetical protein [Pseudoalteromonas aliena SW19]